MTPFFDIAGWVCIGLLAVCYLLQSVGIGQLWRKLRDSDRAHDKGYLELLGVVRAQDLAIRQLIDRLNSITQKRQSRKQEAHR